MLVSVIDTLEITDSRETANGFMVFDARLARSGIYTYLAGEVGFTDMKPDAVVSIYRPDSSVFDEASMASFAHIAVTDDHPPEMVDASNWTKYAKGYTGDTVKRDGEFVRVPMMLTDAGLIQKFKDGKRELSAGYTADVIRQDGEAPGLGKFHGLMGAPKGNHAAVVNAGRAGSQCRLGDAWPVVADTKPKTGDRTMNTKTILVDGLMVETTDAGEAAITKLQGQIAAHAGVVTAKDTTIGEQSASIAAKDGEIVALKKQLDDATLTPERLDAAVAARSVVIDNARKVLGKDFDGKGLTDAAIRKAAVTKYLGDAMPADMADAAIDGAFKVIEAAKVTAKDAVASVVLDGVKSASLDDAATRATDARAAMIAELSAAPAAGAA